MIQTFLCHLEGKNYTAQELQEQLKFNYLPHIDFESLADKREIKKRGLKKWKSNQVSAESQELGVKYRKEIEDGYLPPVSIRWINEQIGYGLYAEEHIEVGAYAGEYTGIVRKNDRLYFEPLNNYCYEYPVPDDIGRSYVIDATQGNVTRFINHSVKPNLKPVYAFYDGFYHLIFLVIAPIEKGTQLSYNYGQNYWCVREKPININ